MSRWPHRLIAHGSISGDSGATTIWDLTRMGAWRKTGIWRIERVTWFNSSSDYGFLTLLCGAVKSETIMFGYDGAAATPNPPFSVSEVGFSAPEGWDGRLGFMNSGFSFIAGNWTELAWDPAGPPVLSVAMEWAPSRQGEVPEDESC